MARKQQSDYEPSEQRVVRPVAEIIHQFLAEMDGHPDAALASAEIAGPVPANLLLPNTPRSVQHLTSLRIVYRDPVQTPQEKANKPWKWAGVVEQLNAEPERLPDGKPNPRWAGVIVPSKNLEPVEAGV